MSLFNQASLVLEPAVYETSKVYATKPFDGSGDLSFSRSNDTATRVGPDGLIEKVRTNAILQSNTFNVTWLITNATITSGATAPDGTATAWTLANTAASGIIQQAATLAGTRSVSIYAKAGTHRYLRIGAYGGTNSYQNFDLQDGVITSGTNGRIESVGGGWYRCTSFGADGTTGGVQIFPSNTATGAATTNGNILIWRCQYESGDIATQPILTTTAAVSVGPVANVPRLDYLNSSCPRLLLEGQRTNLSLYSEQIDNAAWIKTNVTIAANSTTSPDGYVGSDKVEENGGVTGSKQVTQSFSQTASTYSFSFFAKKDERTEVGIVTTGGGMATQETIFDLNAGTLVSGNGAIYDYGNGWFRCVQIFTTLDNTSILVRTRPLVSGSNSYTGVSGYGLYLWGAQLEVGYATSYIPTLGAAVTRGADAASKTGISSLIGQTEGTLFLDITLGSNPITLRLFSVSAPTWTDHSIRIDWNAIVSDSKIVCEGVYAGAQTFILNSINAYTSGTRLKIGIAYKSNDCVMYINGVQQSTDTTTGTIPSCSVLALNELYGFASGSFEKNDFNQTLLFKTRLPNSSLAELTSL